MRYKVIRDLIRRDLQTFAHKGMGLEDMELFTKKYSMMKHNYKTLHPFRYVLIRVFPFLGEIF